MYFDMFILFHCYVCQKWPMIWLNKVFCSILFYSNKYRLALSPYTSLVPLFYPASLSRTIVDGDGYQTNPIPIKGSKQANENGPILDREISRDFIIDS